MICTKFVPLERGALCGFADLELDSGLVIHDARLMESSGKRWVNLPGKPSSTAIRTSCAAPME
jgi:DNA-binding cell septation regulator SpoVG